MECSELGGELVGCNSPLECWRLVRNRTRVAAVKEKRITVIQGNFAAWIALYRTRRTQGNAYWTLNGLANMFRARAISLLPRILKSAGEGITEPYEAISAATLLGVLTT
jgi:hypothetical protein